MCTENSVNRKQRRSSGKGKRKLVKMTFINRHFLVKEKVVAAGKTCYFCLMHTRQVLSLRYFMHCCCVPPSYAHKDHVISLSVKSWNRSEM